MTRNDIAHIIAKHCRGDYTWFKDAADEIYPRIEALEAALTELADLMDDVRTGDYKPDSFTTQPARTTLAPEREKISLANALKVSLKSLSALAPEPGYWVGTGRAGNGGDI